MNFRIYQSPITNPSQSIWQHNLVDISITITHHYYIPSSSGLNFFQIELPIEKTKGLHKMKTSQAHKLKLIYLWLGIKNIVNGYNFL